MSNNSANDQTSQAHPSKKFIVLASLRKLPEILDRPPEIQRAFSLALTVVYSTAWRRLC